MGHWETEMLTEPKTRIWSLWTNMFCRSSILSGPTGTVSLEKCIGYVTLGCANLLPQWFICGIHCCNWFMCMGPSWVLKPFRNFARDLVLFSQFFFNSAYFIFWLVYSINQVFWPRITAWAHQGWIGQTSLADKIPVVIDLRYKRYKGRNIVILSVI